MEYETDDLDIRKLNELEMEDEPYDDFYPEEIDVIKIFFIYVNSKNKIVAIKNDNILINENKLSKLELSILMKKNKKYNGISFEPLSLLKYNIELSPQEVKNYLNNVDSYNFLKVEKNIQDIHWNDSIALFKDMNSLYVIYYEKKRKTNNYTKRIKLVNKGVFRYTRKKN